jgi:Family of unknown function (DUF5343)
VPAYPYVASPDKIPTLFKKIGEIGIPKKFGVATLKSVGFTSSNDGRLISVVKFLDFTDQSGTPTPLWTEYRKHPKSAIAKAVTAAYSDLFQHYADADKRDTEALRTYFAASSSLGAVAVAQMVGTFKALCRLGDFSEVSSIEERQPDLEDQAPPRRSSAVVPAMTTVWRDGLTVNLNIQLQLPSDATAETYERFFEAMRKHLLTPTQPDA